MGTERAGFEIPISTPADLSGTQATIAKLKELRAQAEAAGDGMRASLIDNSISKIQPAAEASGEAAKKLGQGFQEAGKDAAHFEQHTEGMHRLLRLMGVELGPLGHLLHFVFNPQAIGIAALTIGIGEAMKALDELNKKLDEMGKSAAERSNDLTKPFSEATATVMEMQAAYSEWAAKLQEDNGAIGRALTATIEKIREEAKAANDLLKEQKALADEQIKVQQALGLISPAEAARRSTLLDQSASKKERESSAKEMQDEIRATGQALVDTKSELAEKTAAAAKAEAEAEDKKRIARSNKIPEDIEKAQKDLGDINNPSVGSAYAQLNEAKEKTDSLRQQAEILDRQIRQTGAGSDLGQRLRSARNLLDPKIKGAEQDEAAAKAAVDGQKKLIELLRDEQTKLGLAQKEAATKASDLRSQISGLTEKLRGLEDQLGRLKTKAEIGEKSEQSIGPVRKQKEGLQTPQGVADAAAQGAAAGIKGVGAANNAAAAAATQARLLDEAFRTGKAVDSTAFAQLHQAFTDLMGLIHNQSVTTAKKKELEDLAAKMQRDIAALEKKLIANQKSNYFQTRF